MTNNTYTYNIRVIALAGKKGYGKSTIAAELSQMMNCEVMSFADSLRDVARIMYPSVPERFYKNRQLKETPTPLLNGKTPREALIDIGQTAKKYDPLVWSSKVVRKIKRKFIMADSMVIIDDLRFPDELVQLRENFPLTTVIHLERNSPFVAKSIFDKFKMKSSQDSPTEVGVRHMFDSNKDFILNTSDQWWMTQCELKLMQQKLFEPNYEL